MHKTIIATLILIVWLCTCSFAAPQIEAARFFSKSNYGAEILLDGRTILRIYSSSESGLPIYERAEQISQTLKEFIAKGYDIGSIEPQLKGSRAYAAIGGIPVFSIEQGDISGTKIPPLLLAFDWSNRIRRAFGRPRLTQDKIDQIIKVEKMQGIKVSVKQEQEYSEIVINGQVVMRTHDTGGELSAYDKARMIAQQLEESVMDGIKSRKVRPSVEDGNIFSVKMGDSVVSLIDREEALINNSNLWDLAMQWTNKIRSAMGTSPFTFSSFGSKIMQFGKASWYGGFFHGRRTSSGDRFNMFEYTAAHKTLPFGTEVLVTRLDNYKSVIVRITDRGPFIAGRIIDLSRSAAESIGLVKSGVTKVRIDVLEQPSSNKFLLDIDQKLIR